MKPLLTGVCDDCGQDTILEIPGLCATCNGERRKEAKRESRVKVVKPIRKVSKKMAKEQQDYSVLRRIHLQKHPECQVRLEGICDGQATDVHHSAGRSSNLLNEETFVSCCRSCHIHLHDKMSAEERREKGFLLTVNKTV